MRKAIYDAPVVEQLKDLRRACDMALDWLDTMPLKNITPQDMRRSGLKDGEFALCDWVVRPRFPESEGECCGGPTYPITFKDWWESLPPSPTSAHARIVSNANLNNYAHFEISDDLARAVWKSMGMRID